MFKRQAAVIASAAAVLLSSAAAVAGQTMSISRVFVADLGRDTIELSKLKDVAPAISGNVKAEYPSIDYQLGVHGTTVVAVRLTAGGRLTSASVVQSSGHPRLDRSALATAQGARYHPASIGGSPVGGTYAVVVEFDPER